MENFETLESEVKKFADTLPYWAKLLALKILSGNTIIDEDIVSSYSYLLEELTLKENKQRSDTVIGYNASNTENYQTDLFLTKLENVEGVNALTENQTIEFSPNLTIIYGANGSGKSGYVRLLKNVFYSKAPEKILQNVHINHGHKPINARFSFKSNNSETTLTLVNKNNAEFRQFAVFDGKSIFKQLEQMNEFEFRPAGLSFFADFTNAINRVKEKLSADIQDKQSGYSAADLADLFEKDSEIKAFVQTLNAETKSEDLGKYTPFSDEDKTQKKNKQKQCDELQLAINGKEKEVKKLEEIKRLLLQNKQKIESLNQHFSAETILKIKTAITDCIAKESTAKAEGIEIFKTDKIHGIGTDEWKNFILSADAFAKTQKEESCIYPEKEDYCLFCHQPLSNEAQKLISAYWTFIKNTAEQNAKQAQTQLKNEQGKYENLNFELFPPNDIFTNWLNEKYPKELDWLKQKIAEQKELAKNLVADIQNKTANERVAINVSTERYATIEANIDLQISTFKGDELSKSLENLLKEKTFLEHKEKYNTHISKFEDFVNKQTWIKRAQQANFAKRSITEKEKTLSNKYFNQKYIGCFNEECKKLNGIFGIEINHIGSEGKSYRQLKLKGQNPSAVLSEGEQKVIAIADFLAEMQLSEVNRGIIFDDPVTSLDEKRKSEIAERLVKESLKKQVIIFTHDLVFVSNILVKSENTKNAILCHWIESRDGKPRQVWLNNSPSYEKEYRNAEPAKKILYHL